MQEVSLINIRIYQGQQIYITLTGPFVLNLCFRRLLAGQDSTEHDK